MSKTNTQTETPNPTPQKETNSLPNQSNNKRFTTTIQQNANKTDLKK